MGDKRRTYQIVRKFLFNQLNREFLTFLFFLALSGTFWLLLTLNETYEREFKIPVKVVNIPKNLTAGELSNGYKIRRAAIDLNVPLITNARLASAFIHAFCHVNLDDIDIKSWAEYK